MIRHVLLTGEIGIGKSTVLQKTIKALGLSVGGLQSYSLQARGVLPKTLYLRAYGDRGQGEFLCELPDGDKSRIAPVFDDLGAKLLLQAQAAHDVIVIDEIGRLERFASAYHQALEACFSGDKPVLGVIRKHKAEWADWIRERQDVLLLEVTKENRDTLFLQAASCIQNNIGK